MPMGPMAGIVAHENPLGRLGPLVLWGASMGCLWVQMMAQLLLCLVSNCVDVFMFLIKGALICMYIHIYIHMYIHAFLLYIYTYIIIYIYTSIYIAARLR
jgi:hypothetical protein